MFILASLYFGVLLRSDLLLNYLSTASQLPMYIVAIAWIYVVFMMSITERSIIAGVMTFLFYGVLPVAIILYVMGTPQRKRRRLEAEKMKQDSEQPTTATASPGSDTGSEN